VLNPYLTRSAVASAAASGSARVAADPPPRCCIDCWGCCTALAVERALITCDQDNRGSATVIERCGGVLQDVVEDDDVLKRRYWVDLVRA